MRQDLNKRTIKDYLEGPITETEFWSYFPEDIRGKAEEYVDKIEEMLLDAGFPVEVRAWISSDYHGLMWDKLDDAGYDDGESENLMNIGDSVEEEHDAIKREEDREKWR
jgi:hypothetical protein